MNWTKNLPGWLTLGVLGAIVVGVLAVVGWIKPYLSGPNLALTTIYRPKPVPVKVETVKWLTKTTVKKETVTVPVEVIREVPAKEQAHLQQFGINFLDLKAKNENLVDVLAVPRAPYGGEMALLGNTVTGKISGTFLPQAAPFIEFGGIREVGLDYDPLHSRASGYYRQDLVRLGPGIVNGKVFAGIPLTPGGRAPDYGVSVGVAVRF